MEFNTRLREAWTHGRGKLKRETRESDWMTSLFSSRNIRTGARGQNSPEGTYQRTLTLSKGIREGYHHMRIFPGWLNKKRISRRKKKKITKIKKQRTGAKHFQISFHKWAWQLPGTLKRPKLVTVVTHIKSPHQ